MKNKDVKKILDALDKINSNDKADLILKTLKIPKNSIAVTSISPVSHKPVTSMAVILVVRGQLDLPWLRQRIVKEINIRCEELGIDKRYKAEDIWRNHG